MSISFGTTAELISADFFKGHPSILLFSEDNPLIEAGLAAEGIKVMKEYKEGGATPDIVIGYGEKGIVEGKAVSLKYKLPLYIIPSSFAPIGLIEDVFKKNSLDLCQIPCEIVYCRELFVEQPRESVSVGMGFVSTLLVTLIDSFYQDIVFGREERGEQTLKYIRECLTTASTYSLSMGDLSEKLLGLIIEMQNKVKELEQENLSLIGARLFSLYKRGSDNYSDFLFVMAYTMLSVYVTYEVPPPLIFPCDRLYFRDILNDLELTERESIPCDVKDLVRRSYLLSEWIDEIKSLRSLFNDFGKTFKRLTTSSGYRLTELATSEELILILPLLAEYSEGWSVLKQLYSEGILEKLG